MSDRTNAELHIPDDLGERLRAAWLAEGRTYVIEADAAGNVFYSDLRTGAIIEPEEARRRSR